MMEEAGRDRRISLLASSFEFMNGSGECYSLPVREGWSNNNLIPWAVENPSGINFIEEEKMLLHNYFQGCAMLVRKDLARSVIEKGDIPAAHDWVLAYAASLENGLAYLDQPLFDYRIHDANTTGLPQAGKRSKIRTLKTWFNWYYRLAVVEDMKRILEVVRDFFPRGWNDERKERLEFCNEYLKDLKGKKLKAYLGLYSHPGRKASMSTKEFAVGAAFVFLSRFVSFPDHKN